MSGVWAVVPGDATGVDVEAKSAAIEHEVSRDAMVVTAADGGSVEVAHEQVALDEVAAVAVVEVDADGSGVVMNEVVEDSVAAAGPIALRVDGAHVMGGEHGPGDFIALNEVFIAAEDDSGVGGVVDEVAGENASDGIS